MINAKMREYDYFSFGSDNGYGQPQLGKEPEGKVKMALSLTSQSVQDNINYKDANYVGLTLSSLLDDKKAVKVNTEMFKVLYVNNEGRYKEVFLKRM